MAVPVPHFELENAGTGASSFRLDDYLADEAVETVVLVLLRDHHCPRCRRQVQDLAARYDEFVAEHALVVAVLPESIERARTWQDAYELPYPLLADPNTTVADELDQPTRFGAFGQLHDMIGRMPVALVVDVRGGKPELTYVYRGSMPGDRPTVDGLLAEVRSRSERSP